ncbi:MAG: hypothetical protein KF716_20295 [Anaerolineae bacterium]|nr:hypothetical protein [Anaerolineae bacterium]
MGRLLTVHPCPMCNYHVEDELHEGGSGSAVLFLRNHYVLALCNDCHNLVSVLVKNNEQETQDAVRQAQYDIVQLEADAVIGDLRAKDLLPFYRDALDHFKDDYPEAATKCSMCGSDNIDLQLMESSKFDQAEAWIPCPRCEEGRLLIEASGRWD